jgi:transcriptional regulator with XRE-family HTH domain
MFDIEKENFKYIVGNLIRKIRLEKSLTQNELADKSNIERSTVSSIERGEKNVSFYTMYKIIMALEIDDITEFFNQI